MTHTNNRAAIDDVVYALCLKSGIDIRATNKNEYKLDTSTITNEQKKIINKSVKDIFLEYANKNKKDNIPDYNQDNDLVDIIYKYDLYKIISAYIRELWLKSNNSKFEEFYNIVNMLEWHETDNDDPLRPVMLFKTFTHIVKSQKIAEGSSEFPVLPIQEPEKFDKIKENKFYVNDLNFSNLINNFETFKSLLEIVLLDIQMLFRKEFIRQLVLNRDKIQCVTGQTDIKQTLNKVINVFNNTTDEQGNRLMVHPDFIYSTLNLSHELNNSSNDYNLKVVTDSMLGRKDCEYLTDNKSSHEDDIYFISKGSILYLSPNFTLSPQITLIDDNNDKNYKIGFRFIYGIAIVNPECIVCVEGKPLLDN